MMDMYEKSNKFAGQNPYPGNHPNQQFGQSTRDVLMKLDQRFYDPNQDPRYRNPYGR
jgi:hypothetical protein